MNHQKRVLVLGATGAMGQYLVPLLADKGYLIDAVAWDDFPGEHPNIRSIKTANAKEPQTYYKLLAEHYDGIVDFLIYPTAELCQHLPFALDHTDHYIYLSTYRIYDNKEIPIRETSPRLLDTADDILLRNSDDYSVYKARGENILKARERKNWTAIRPAITYSLMRYQLVTLEAPYTVGRAFAGKTVAVPEPARNIEATMSWAGDVAQMIAGLLFNPAALGEIFTVATSEHHTWGEIADMYKEICGMKTIWVDKEDYLKIFTEDPYNFGPRWQLEYDRFFSRVIDNSKVLSATGMKQSELMTLFDGLSHEIARCPRDRKWSDTSRMDECLKKYL